MRNKPQRRTRRILAILVLVSGLVAACTTGQPESAGQPFHPGSEGSATPSTRQAEQLVLPVGRFYVRWAPGSERHPARILPVRQVSALDLSGVGRRIFTLHAPANSLRTSVRRVSITGRHQVTLVERAGVALDLAANRRFVFWDQDQAIARASVDGNHLRRRWLVLPRRDRQGGGTIMNGMTARGRFLYLSQCARGRIGRVPFNTRNPRVEWIVRGITTCPEDLAVTGSFIYWEGSTFRSGAGVIGRAPASGGTPENRWTSVGSFDGPDDVETAGDFVYWTWGGAGPRPRHFLGRVRADGTGFNRKVRRLAAGQITVITP